MATKSSKSSESSEPKAKPKAKPKVEPARAPTGTAWEFKPWCDRVEKTAQMNGRTLPEDADLKSLYAAGNNPWEAYLRLCHE